MGIELPGELVDIANRAGVRWPAADEEAMRDQAEAWREAAEDVEVAGRRADSLADQALDGFTGATADGARREWRTFVDADAGDYPLIVQGCLAAADRLEHGAEQVGAAKVAIVRRLVVLAQRADAAEQAAAAGHTDALAGLDSLFSAARTEFAQIQGGLAEAVDLGNGVMMPGATPVAGASSPTALTFSSPEALLGDEDGIGEGAPFGLGQHDGDFLERSASDSAFLLEEVMSSLVAEGEISEEFAVRSGEEWGLDEGFLGGRDGQPIPDVPGEETPPPPSEPSNTGGPPLPASTRGTAPSGTDAPVGTGAGVPAAVPGPPVHSAAPPAPPVAGTPPITEPPAAAAPPSAPPPAGAPPAGAGPGEVTGPTRVDPNWAGSAPAQPTAPAERQPGGQPVPPPPPGGGQPPGGHLPAGGLPAAPPGAGGPGLPHGGPAPAVPPGSGGAGGAGAPGGQADPGRGAGAAPPLGGQPKPMPFRPEFPVGGGTAVPPGAAVAPAPAPAPGQQPLAPVAGAAPVAKQVLGPGAPDGPAAPPAEPRTTRRTATPQGELPEVASFVMHLFPLGRIPVPEVEPARQRPAPAPDSDYAPGGRYAPQDHPRADLVNTLDTPGGEGPDGSGPAPEGTSPPGAAVAVPEPTPTDREWDRRFVVRGIDLATGRPPEYAWPPPELFPEGAADPGGLEPVVLSEGAELDRFGDEEGRLLCRAGAPFEARSLPPGHADREYARYRVARPLPVWAGPAAAWFAQPGGALRYRTTYAVAELVAMGYLDRLGSTATGGDTT